MKYCPKCGKENNSEAKFCKECGAAIEENNTSNVVNNTTEVQKHEGLGTASMVMGIIALVLSFTCFVIFPLFIVIPLALVGLILGIVNKVQKGKKFSGIILNAVAIFVAILMTVLFVFVFAVAVEEEAKRKGTDVNSIINEIFDKAKDYNGSKYID